MKQIHTYAIRKVVQTGVESKVELGEMDGKLLSLDAVFRAGEFVGYYTESALLIVNKWNYVATLSRKIEFIYYLPAVEQ